ncbi:MAG TPA: D-arabinono-1,4-lactone oxidase [Actinomycetota bacterium]|nr:D-arabinono-1,4-lactone oxidase [Actinomycetota bacterium]
MPGWGNWAGTASCRPARIVAPESDDELAWLLAEAFARGERVKIVGSGHSFTDAACTNEIMIRSDRLTRVLDVDRAARRVTVQPGITIHALAERLAAEGLAFRNLGDIGEQTIGGAIATATHGTGARSGTLSSQVSTIEMLAVDGRRVRCAPGSDGDLLAAARVSLGALGAMIAITLDVEEAYTLHAVEETMPLKAVLRSLESLADDNDHFELFWFPHTERALTKRNNRIDAPPRPRPRTRQWLDQELVANTLFGAVCRVGRARETLIPPMARLAGRLLPRTEHSDRSDRIFTSPRRVRFAELEYAIPRPFAADALRAVRALIERRGYRISFPVELRFTAADDDAFLSPAAGRPTAYLAVHVFQGMPYEAIFRDVEALMAGFDGRPHWGKIHFLAAEDLAGRYPGWDAFAAVRKRLDPGGLFRNDYLDRVLGVG